MPREQGAGRIDHRLRRAAELRLPRLRRLPLLVTGFGFGFGFGLGLGSGLALGLGLGWGQG